MIQSDRAAAAPYNGMACIILRDIKAETDPAAFDINNPQVLVLVNDRELFFYADEVTEGDKAKDEHGNEIEPKRVMPRSEMPAFDRDRHAATGDQAAWDTASALNTVASMEAYLVQYPLGTHAQEARLRRSQIAPGLPPLAPLPPEVQAAQAGQAPVVAKDEERNLPPTGNHPEIEPAATPPAPKPQGQG